MNQSQLKTIKTYLDAKIPALRALAVREFKPEMLLNVVLWDVQRNPKLAECTPQSILYCVKHAVQLGLPLGGTYGYLHMVPYKGIATPVLGYKGVVDIVTRGEDARVTSVHARTVHAGDTFNIKHTERGTEFAHTPCMNGDPGDIIGAYAVFHYKDAPPYVEWMGRDALEKVRRTSKFADRPDSPWVVWPEEMCKKTVTKRGSKYVPMNVFAVGALTDDDAMDTASAKPMDADFEVVEEPKPTQTEDIKNTLRKTGQGMEGDEYPVDDVPGVESAPKTSPQDEREYGPQDEREYGPQDAASGPAKGPEAEELKAQIQRIGVEHNELYKSTLKGWKRDNKKGQPWSWANHATIEELRSLLKHMRNAMAAGHPFN